MFYFIKSAMSFTGQAVEEAVYKIGAVAPRLGQLAQVFEASPVNFGLSVMKTGENFIGSNRKALDFPWEKTPEFPVSMFSSNNPVTGGFWPFSMGFLLMWYLRFGAGFGDGFWEMSGFFGDVGSRRETVITCFSLPNSIWKIRPETVHSWERHGFVFNWVR